MLDLGLFSGVGLEVAALAAVVRGGSPFCGEVLLKTVGGTVMIRTELPLWELDPREECGLVDAERQLSLLRADGIHVVFNDAFDDFDDDFAVVTVFGGLV